MNNGAFSEAFARKKTWKTDPGLASAIREVVDTFDTRVVADIGAGAGEYVRWLRTVSKADCHGFDATPNIEDISGGDVTFADFTRDGSIVMSKWFGLEKQIDLCLCIEVGEHIQEEDLESYFDNVAYAVDGYLLYSHAIPNQRGRDHVSCRSPEWCANQFGLRGLTLKENMTLHLRGIAGKGWDRKLMFFEGQD